MPTSRTINRPALEDAKVILDGMLENFNGNFTEVGSYIYRV